MTPRQYDMTKRAAAVEETKRRILDATKDLHESQGVLATRWEDIAERADVSLATVYRYFPTLDTLVPACGELSMRQLALPSDEEIAERFAGARSRRERVRRLVEAVFEVYERGGPVIWVVRRDRASLPVLQEAHELIEQRLTAIVRAATEPLDLHGRELGVVRALTDYDAWQALRDRGIIGADAVDTASSLLEAWLSRR